MTSTEATAWGECPNCEYGIRPGDFIHSCAEVGWTWEHDDCDDNEREYATRMYESQEKTPAVAGVSAGKADSEVPGKSARASIPPPLDPSTDTLRRAARLLREWWPSGCECHAMEREVAGWLEMTAEQIDESSHEFSMVPYPTAHDRRAMRVAVAVLAQEDQ